MRLLSLLIVALVAPSGIGETRIVHVGDFYFQDQASMNAHTRINVGDSVKWQWISGNHTTTEVNELWNAAINSVTQTYERSFNEPGLWEYYCTMDPLVMRGTVRAVGTQTHVQPTGFDVNPGRIVSGGFNSILASDNDRIIIRPGPVFSSLIHPITILASTQIPPGTGDNLLTLRVEGHASSTSVVLRIRIYNPFKAQWVLLQQDFLPTGDIVVDTIVTDPENYMTPATATTVMEVTFRTLGPVVSYPWEARVDHIEWIAE